MAERLTIVGLGGAAFSQPTRRYTAESNARTPRSAWPRR